MNYPEYKDKRVLITGASSGIGEAIAHELVTLGAEVHALSRRKPAIEVASYQQLDLSDPKSIAAAAASIDGRIDTLFNCAGALPMADPADILKVNFLGTRLLTGLIVDRMEAGSAIVNTSSDGGYAWRKKRALILDFLRTEDFDGGLEWYTTNEDAAGHAYSFSKEALDVWTMQQSSVLIKRGIRINTVSPGAVETPMLEAIEGAFTSAAIDPVTVPSGRRSTAAEQVGPHLFLGSDSASYVNGADIAVDGGFWATLNIAGKLWD